MEAAGLAAACDQCGADWLVIRGVSDFGDKRKTANYQPFAAQMAAAVARDFVEVGLQLGLARPRKARRALSVPSMPTRAEILAATSQLPTSPGPLPPPSGGRMLELAMPFEGRVYRVLSPARGRVPIPPRLATRWSPGLGVLYFTMTEKAAVAEVRASLASLPRDLLAAEFKVRLLYVLDLTRKSMRDALGITSDAIHSPDYTYCQSLAKAAPAGRM
jgi:hypothetical protein